MESFRFHGSAIRVFYVPKLWLATQNEGILCVVLCDGVPSETTKYREIRARCLDLYKYMAWTESSEIENQLIDESPERKPRSIRCERGHECFFRRKKVFRHRLPLIVATRQRATFFFFWFILCETPCIHIDEPCVPFHQNVKVNPNFIFHNLFHQFRTWFRLHLRWICFFSSFLLAFVLKACGVYKFVTYARPTSSFFFFWSCFVLDFGCFIPSEMREIESSNRFAVRLPASNCEFVE